MGRVKSHVLLSKAQLSMIVPGNELQFNHMIKGKFRARIIKVQGRLADVIVTQTLQLRNEKIGVGTQISVSITLLTGVEK